VCRKGPLRKRPLKKKASVHVTLCVPRKPVCAEEEGFPKEAKCSPPPAPHPEKRGGEEKAGTSGGAGVERAEPAIPCPEKSGGASEGESGNGRRKFLGISYRRCKSSSCHLSDPKEFVLYINTPEF